jgi:ankyrin repeat protein
MDAARLGYVEIVRLLLEYGADANQETDSSMYTPLMSAARFGQTEIAKILIDAGANVNAEDDWEESVLLRAVESNHPKMVELLLSHGADPLQRCGYVENALALAKQLGFEEIVELLERSYNVD